MQYITSEWGLNILHRDVMTIEQMLAIKNPATLSALVLDEVGFNLIYFKLIPVNLLNELPVSHLQFLSTNTGMEALYTKNLKIEEVVKMSEGQLKDAIASVLESRDAARRRLTFSLAEQLDDQLNVSKDNGVSLVQ